MNAMLEIKNLYGGYEKDVNILQGIDLTVAEGEAVGIIGLNGSGKSTLGKAVMNLIPYRKGSIVFDGQHVERKSTHELAQLGIAMMHQGGVVFPNLSVWQNLVLAFGTNINKSYYKQLVEVIPLLQHDAKELMHKMADRLSGGQRHELALAMTLARQPKLVILDEPSAGLSPQAVMELYQRGEIVSENSSALCPAVVSQINGILVELKSRMNLSILLVEQNVSMACSFCDRCVLIEQGRISQEFEGNYLEINNLESLLFNFNK